MPKTHTDVINEYRNLIAGKLALLADEPYRVWADTSENRAKEARFEKFTEFQYGMAIWQGADGPKFNETTGETYYKMFAFAMLMKAPAAPLNFGSVDDLIAAATRYNGPTHLAIMCCWESFQLIIAREMAGVQADGTVCKPKQHIRRLTVVWDMLEHVESVACWQKWVTPTWPKFADESEEILLGKRIETIEPKALYGTFGNQPQNVHGRDYRPNPRREDHHIDDGVFEEDE